MRSITHIFNSLAFCLRSLKFNADVLLIFCTLITFLRSLFLYFYLLFIFLRFCLHFIFRFQRPAIVFPSFYVNWELFLFLICMSYPSSLFFRVFNKYYVHCHLHYVFFKVQHTRFSSFYVYWEIFHIFTLLFIVLFPLSL